jgi:hypothetical protein
VAACLKHGDEVAKLRLYRQAGAAGHTFHDDSVTRAVTMQITFQEAKLELRRPKLPLSLRSRELTSNHMSCQCQLSCYGPQRICTPVTTSTRKHGCLKMYLTSKHLFYHRRQWLRTLYVHLLLILAGSSLPLMLKPVTQDSVCSFVIDLSRTHDFVCSIVIDLSLEQSASNAQASDSGLCMFICYWS